MSKGAFYTRKGILVIVVAALAGALLGVLGMSRYLDRDNRWVRLVSPPGETITEIVALDRGLDAYVRTQQGNLYLCGGNSWRNACSKVSVEELPASRVHAQWRTCGSTFPQTPPVPGVIVDAIEVGRCLEAATYSKLVVLNDGSLWQWTRTFSWVNSFALVTCGVLGLGLGLVAGLFFVKLGRALRET